MLNEILTTISSLALDLFLITSMLAMGMSLTVKQIIDPLRNVKLVLLTLVSNFVLVPALAFLLRVVLPLGQPQATALILLGACAGAPFLPKLAQMAKGDLATSVGMMVLLMVVTIFFAPLVLPLVLPGAQVDVGAIARSLILLMLLPLVIGLLVKWRYADTADEWQPHLSQASTYSLMILVVAGLLLQFRNIIGAIGSWLIIGTVLLVAGGIVIGGDVAMAHEQLLAGIREVVYQRSLPLATRHLRIVRSQLADRAGVIGAAVMVIEHVLSPGAVDAAIATMEPAKGPRAATG